jgi:hypothetical protein
MWCVCCREDEVEFNNNVKAWTARRSIVLRSRSDAARAGIKIRHPCMAAPISVSHATSGAQTRPPDLSSETALDIKRHHPPSLHTQPFIAKQENLHSGDCFRHVFQAALLSLSAASNTLHANMSSWMNNL